MADIRPFKALRPRSDLAKKIASLPYDVMDTQEAREQIRKNPLSFLSVTKSEAQLADEIDVHSQIIYDKAKENLLKYQEDRSLVVDSKPCFYIYRQKMNAHEQIGIVGASSVEEYRKNIIKKHELTRPDKEDDRVNHIKTLAAQTGAVFLAYKKSLQVEKIVQSIMQKNSPVYDFTSDDGIEHTLYVVDKDDDIIAIKDAFLKIDYLYIADGHHRSAAAMRVADLCQKNNKNHTGEEDYNYFLTVIFPDDMMQILDYNRAVKDLNGLSEQEFLQKVQQCFIVQKLEKMQKPTARHEFRMYLAGQWYCLKAKSGSFDETHPTASLDVSILQDNLLKPILGIIDPRVDQRIMFIGGIRGLDELVKLVDDKKAQVAFAMYPTSMQELMDIADNNQIMPPKSTWFEPKLRDAMAIHLIEEEFCK